MLLVNVIIIMLIRMGEASLITVTRTNPPDASITSPPPLHGRGQQGKRDETVTIRGPGTCGFLSMKFHFLIEPKEIHDHWWADMRNPVSNGSGRGRSSSPDLRRQRRDMRDVKSSGCRRRDRPSQWRCVLSTNARLCVPYIMRRDAESHFLCQRYS